jgi:hypothetical protein
MPMPARALAEPPMAKVRGGRVAAVRNTDAAGRDAYVRTTAGPGSHQRAHQVINIPSQEIDEAQKAIDTIQRQKNG